MFPERKCQVMFPSYLSQDVYAVVRFRYVLCEIYWMHGTRLQMLSKNVNIFLILLDMTISLHTG